MHYQYLRRRCQEIGVGEELKLTTEAAVPRYRAHRGGFVFGPS
jgi:hypothetical protein